MMSWCLERPRGHNDNKDTFYQLLTDKQLAIDTEAYQSFLGPTNACKILPLLPACMQQYSTKIPFVVMNYSGLGKASFPIQRRARDKKARVVRLTCCLGVFCIKIAHLPTHLEFKSDTMALANVVAQYQRIISTLQIVQKFLSYACSWAIIIQILFFYSTSGKTF